MSNDIRQQLADHAALQHKRKFLEVISAKSGIVITPSDIDFATSLTRDELFITALICSAKARTSVSPEEKGAKQ